jgi:hypothetical protein
MLFARSVSSTQGSGEAEATTRKPNCLDKIRSLLRVRQYGSGSEQGAEPVRNTRSAVR